MFTEATIDGTWEDDQIYTDLTPSVSVLILLPFYRRQFAVQYSAFLARRK